MKQITLSHTTALAALRDLRTNSHDTINLTNECLLGNIICNKIDIIVMSKNNIYKNELFNHHLSQNKICYRTAIQLSKNIRVTCPEMTIVHMASVLNYFELALLMHEFCGTFSYKINGEQNFTSNLPPLTTVDKIQNFIKTYTKNSTNIQGLKNLNSVLKFVSNNSASPMESRLYIKLAGPRFRGLYGCNNLELNKEIALSKDASKISGQSIIKPDISNIRKKVAIEYDSTQFHNDSIQGQKDKRRRDGLVKDG